MSTGTNSNFPKARTADLITEKVGDELVVYDGKSSEAHCLSALAAAVFVAADGKTSPADLAAIASRQLQRSVDVPEVEHALVELEDRDLVEPTASGISRRGFMQRGAAAVGGAVVAGSLVTSVVTPAYGSTGSTGTFGAYSSLAVLFLQGGTYFGAHWSTGGPPNGGAPTNWGATEANANCALNVPSGQTVSSGSISGVTATSSTSSITISVPAGVTIVSVAAFFGNGGTGCHGCQTDANGGVTVSGSAPTYTLTFNC